MLSIAQEQQEYFFLMSDNIDGGEIVVDMNRLGFQVQMGELTQISKKMSIIIFYFLYFVFSFRRDL